MHNRFVMCLIACGVLVARDAFSQSSDKAMAEALFQQGRTLFDAGKTAEACARFEESLRLEQKLGTLLNLAVCHEKQGRTASAWGEFTEAASLADKRGEADRAAFARERATVLATKQSTITILLQGDAPGLLVIVDGKDLSVQGAALPVDPGRHRIEAKASGRKPWSIELDVPEGPVALTVEVPQLAEQAPEPTAPPAKPDTRSKGDVRSPETTSEEEIHPAAWGCFGVGGAGLLVGAITGGISLKMAGDLKDDCAGGVCVGKQREDLSSANTLANVSNVAFGVGIAGTAAGIIVLLATLPDRAPEPPVAFVPAGDIGGGIRVRF